MNDQVKADSCSSRSASCDEFFYILGFQRSGTSLIQALLGSRPDTNMFPREMWAANFFGSFLGSWITHQRHEYHLARHVISAMIPKPPTDTCYRGFKANVNGIEPVSKTVAGIEEGFLWMKGIILIRNDLVAQVASMSRAQVTGRWHAWVQPEKPHHQDQKTRNDGDKIKIRFDGSTVGYLISLILGQRTLLSFAHRHNLLIIDYEADILSHPSSATQKINAYLGMSPFQYEYERFQKVSPLPEEYVLNYSEAKKFVEALKRCSDAELRAKAKRISYRVSLRLQVQRAAALTKSLMTFDRRC